MPTTSPSTPTSPSSHLSTALLDLVRHPRTTLVASWSWKAATISALLRASLFFATNVRASTHKALHAALVEAVFAIFAAGLMGAISQQLRCANPVWATGIVVWLGMPGLMFFAQRAVHRSAGTPHTTIGLIASFCFAALASSFSWYAMRHGALLGGDIETTLVHDIEALPRIILNYILAIPRHISRS